MKAALLYGPRDIRVEDVSEPRVHKGEVLIKPHRVGMSILEWFLINEKFYQSLPDDLKYLVLDSAKASANVGKGVQNLSSLILAMAKLKEAGNQIYTPTEKERAFQTGNPETGHRMAEDKGGSKTD